MATVRSKALTGRLFLCGALTGALPVLLVHFVYTGSLKSILLALTFPGILVGGIVTGNMHYPGVPWIVIFNAAVYGTTAAVAGTLIRTRRVPEGHRCARCSYDLTGNESGVCPECGRPTGRSPK